MKPTAAPAFFPYTPETDPAHQTMAHFMAGDKPSEKLIERADSAMESGPETLRQQRPGPDQNRLDRRQSMAIRPDISQSDSAQTVFGGRE